MESRLPAILLYLVGTGVGLTISESEVPQIQEENVNNKLVKESFEFENVEQLDPEILKTFKESAHVTTVYYFKNYLPQLKNFFKEFDKSGEYLKAYGVQLGVFDCVKLHDAACDMEKVDQKVFMYRLGATLLELDLQTMFDVNSIMSNVLQLVLLRDVPILQTAEELDTFLYAQKGSRDIIFTYQKAIGTYDHRIFMEVAYAYHETFQFALTTNKDSLAGHFDDSPVGGSTVAIWYLSCKDLPGKAMPCQKSRYVGKLLLSSLARYTKTLTKPPVFNIPADGPESPYEGLHQVIMYYNADSAESVKDMATRLSFVFRGMFGILTMDLDQTDKIPYHYDGKLPKICIKLKNREHPVFYNDEDWELDILAEFVAGELSVNEEYVSSNLRSQDKSAGTSEHAGDDYPGPDIEGVETQDDMVADAVIEARKYPIDFKFIHTLTDKTFPMVFSKDLLIVLFYLPLDVRSMAFLRAYTKASYSFENETMKPLAAVNCFDWTDVCGKEQITMYPTVRIYRKGRSLEYKGMLDTSEVIKTVRLMSQPYLIDLKSNEDIKKFINGRLPTDEEIPGDAGVLGLFDKTHKKELEVFRNVSRNLHGEIMLGANYDGSGAELAKYECQSSLPVVVMVRGNDPLKLYSVYKGKFEEKLLEKFILESRIPVMPELTVHMFPSLYKEKKPFVITFLNENEESDHVMQIMSKVAQMSEFSDLRFCWISAMDDNLGMKVLKEYHKDNIVPTVVYVNLQKGHVDNYLREINEDYPVIDWLVRIVKGEHTPSVTLPHEDWKPVKEGYDFLALMDWDEKHPHSKTFGGKHYDSKAAENGYDEDENGVSVEEDENENDDEIRKELLGLQNSRLYRHSGARKVTENAEKTDVPKRDNSKTKDHDKYTLLHEEL